MRVKIFKFDVENEFQDDIESEINAWLGNWENDVFDIKHTTNSKYLIVSIYYRKAE